MASFQEFQDRLNRHDEALNEVVQDIEDLKDQVAEMGLTLEQEEIIFAGLNNAVSRVESLASENPSPENPNIEQEI